MTGYIISILVLLLISSCGDQGDDIAIVSGGGTTTVGCMDETACNYDSDALEDDGSCIEPINTECINFETDIQSILSNTVDGPGCTDCHSGSNPSSGLDLSSYAALMSNDVIVAGDAATSTLYKKISGTTAGTRMPQSNSTYFDSHTDELQLIENWINEGAME